MKKIPTCVLEHFALWRIQMYLMKNRNNNDVDSYTDHIMYSPETGEGVMTTSYDEHVELARLGFRHSPIERGLYDTPTTVEICQKIHKAIPAPNK